MNNNNTPKKVFLKRFLPKTLLGRSLLILVTPVFLIQVISTYVFFDRHWSKVTSRLAYAAAGEISILSDYVTAVNYDESKLQRLFNQYEEQLSMLVTFDKGANLPKEKGAHRIIHGWEAMIERTMDKELNHAIAVPYTVNVDFQEKWIEVRVQTQGGVLNIAMPQKRLFSSTTYIFLLWVFAASIILLIIAVLFMRNQIRPIRRLSIAAERFGKGREVKNFKVEGAREVRQAGIAFLDMKTRIQRQISQRTEMLAGVSHDLRTPITRLKLQIAMLGDSPDIYEMKRDINEMERMIDGYLNFVRGEGQEQPLFTDISDILKDATTSTKRQGCDVTLNLNNVSAKLPLRKTAFKRCLSNILSNATKYADHIWVELEKKTTAARNEVFIRIEDNGPGIDADKLDEVFRPFYRVDSSRNAETGGVGLGLPIAMDIVHSHGGEIKLGKSEKHGGLEVVITLPI